MIVTREWPIVVRKDADGCFEGRCRKCHDWWPMEAEYWYLDALCAACMGEGIRPEWDYMTYHELRAIRDAIPLRARTPELRAAVRRAYWREFARERRAVCA